MREVANVNGIKVYSNKNLSGVSNTRLSFSDGSWCDVSTGEVFNNGSGFISIGKAPQGATTSAETKTWGPESYQTNALQISGVGADVNVEPHDGGQIVVEMTGPESEIEDIRVREQNGTLVIESEDSGSSRDAVFQNIQIGRGGGGISMSMGRTSGSVVSISGGNISVSSGGSKNSTQIKVKVPRGTPTSFSGVQGNLYVGDTEGNLNLSIQGGWDANIGRVGDASVSVQGSGDVNVSHVDGALSVSIQGSGDVKVRGGGISSLSANVMGSGDVKVGGTCQTASLNVMGSGDIDVAHSMNKPVKNAMGSGDIKVRRVG